MKFEKHIHIFVVSIVTADGMAVVDPRLSSIDWWPSWQRAYLKPIHAHISRHCLFPPLITRLMGPTWGPSGADRTQVGPMLAPWALLSGSAFSSWYMNQSANYIIAWKHRFNYAATNGVVIRLQYHKRCWFYAHRLVHAWINVSEMNIFYTIYADTTHDRARCAQPRNTGLLHLSM